MLDEWYISLNPHHTYEVSVQCEVFQDGLQNPSLRAFKAGQKRALLGTKFSNMVSTIIERIWVQILFRVLKEFFHLAYMSPQGKQFVGSSAYFVSFSFVYMWVSIFLPMRVGALDFMAENNCWPHFLLAYTFWVKWLST